MLLRKVHELTFLWFGLLRPLLTKGNGGARRWLGKTNPDGPVERDVVVKFLANINKGMKAEMIERERKKKRRLRRIPPP